MSYVPFPVYWFYLINNVIIYVWLLTGPWPHVSLQQWPPGKASWLYLCSICCWSYNKYHSLVIYFWRQAGHISPLKIPQVTATAFKSVSLPFFFFVSSLFLFLILWCQTALWYKVKCSIHLSCLFTKDFKN